jgi:hypothetical protein
LALPEDALRDHCVWGVRRCARERVQLLVHCPASSPFVLEVVRGSSVKALLLRLASAAQTCLRFRGEYLRKALPKDASSGESLHVLIAAPLLGGGGSCSSLCSQCCKGGLEPLLAEKDVTIQMAPHPSGAFVAGDANVLAEMHDVARPEDDAARPEDDAVQARQTLSALDERLVKGLRAGDIRLVRSAWLLGSTMPGRMQKRQDLESLEAAGGESPLLSPEEAAQLVGRGNRSAGALTYGWLSAGRDAHMIQLCVSSRHKISLPQ